MYFFTGNTTVYAYDIALSNGDSSIIKYTNVSNEATTLATVHTGSLFQCGHPKGLWIRWPQSGGGRIDVGSIPDTTPFLSADDDYVYPISALTMATEGSTKAVWRFKESAGKHINLLMKFELPQ